MCYLIKSKTKTRCLIMNIDIFVATGEDIMTGYSIIILFIVVSDCDVLFWGKS